MKRIILLVTVALVMAVMATVPAFATVHPQSRAECAESAIAQDQHPPGITGQSNAKADNEAQPIVSVIEKSPQGAGNPSLKGFVEDCPAPNK